VRPEAQQRAVRRPRRRRKKKSSLSLYKLVVIVILIFGGLFISLKMYQLWKIHQDMEITVQQEERLIEEHQKLQQEKQNLDDPDEISKRAREQFGLVKPGEIPYKR